MSTVMATRSQTQRQADTQARFLPLDVHAAIVPAARVALAANGVDHLPALPLLALRIGGAAEHRKRGERDDCGHQCACDMGTLDTATRGSAGPQRVSRRIHLRPIGLRRNPAEDSAFAR
jgi:hypothetical protein